MNKLRLIHKLLAGLVFTACAQILCAQTYPDKPITLVVPNPPGGLVDTSARLLSEPLSRVIGQTVVVDNKPGASGNIAYQYVANAKPDGYTLLISYSGYHVGNPALMDKLPWDPIKDFSPIALLTVSTNVIAVHPSVPVNNLKEFIAYAKTKDLNFGSAGIGSQVHMAAENLTYSANIPATHVPYKGESAAINDLVAGQIDFMVGNLTAATGFAKAGQIKPLAVTSLKRSKQLPDVPTVAESGIPGFESTGWFGLVAPANTPKAITDKIYAATVKAVNSEALRASLDLNGLTAVVNNQKEFESQVKAESAAWEKVIKGRNISAQ